VRASRIVLSAIVLGLVATTPSYAAVKKPKPVCNLLTDPSGDGRSSVMPTVEGAPLDIISADVATGKKTLVGVLRVGSTDASAHHWAKAGMGVSLQFKILGTSYAFERKRKAGTAEDYTYTFQGGPVKSFAVTKNTITWTIDRTAIADLKKPRILITGITASSRPFFSNADAASAPANKTYADKYPSCVKAA
jgi:hypothetical protein